MKRCEVCDGRGWVVCPGCENSTGKTCAKCRGYRRVKCPACNGKGHLEKVED